MLAGEQDVAWAEGLPEGSIAGVAGGLFEAGAGGDLDVDDLEFDAEIVADGLAVGGPGIGGGLQPATALTITTMSAAMVPGEVAIGTFCQDTNMPAFTPGAGWAELGQAANTSASPSLLGEYQLGVPAAQITATGTSSLSSKFAATVMTFRTL